MFDRLFPITGWNKSTDSLFLLLKVKEQIIVQIGEYCLHQELGACRRPDGVGTTHSAAGIITTTRYR